MYKAVIGGDNLSGRLKEWAGRWRCSQLLIPVANRSSAAALKSSSE